MIRLGVMITFMALFCVSQFAAVPVAAEVLDPACNITTTDESGKQVKSPLCPDENETIDDNSLFGPGGIATRLVNLLSYIIAIAGVIVIIIGGFKYVISSGDQQNINNAKNTILYAVIGLAIAAVAQLFVRFVLYNIK